MFWLSISTRGSYLSSFRSGDNAGSDDVGSSKVGSDDMDSDNVGDKVGSGKVGNGIDKDGGKSGRQSGQ